MFGWILFFLLLFVAHKTNPDAASFRAFITSSTTPAPPDASLTSFFSTLLGTKPAIPEFKREDYVCLSVVTVQDDSNATYLGVFGSWFLLSKVVITGGKKRNKLFGNNGENKSEEATELQTLEDAANRDKDQAIKAKVAKDYGTAAKLFMSAAERFQSADGNYNQLEAASCYEDAYKALQQTKQTGKALEALENAAVVYETYDRQAVRAARLYEQLAEQYKKTNSEQKNLTKALKMHEKAAELFEREGDGRHLFSQISQAELSAELGLYEIAISLFDTIIVASSSETALSFKVPTHIFHLCLCLIGLDDWVHLEIRYKTFCSFYPIFAGSRESVFVKKLIDSKSACDATAFATACQDYDQITPLSPWKINLLLKVKQGLDVDDLR